ncbi:MAG: hypothetical protein J5800_01865, partial [Spirochaetales bacterium]|nr:hypothetical protein [Spirochaetales bacterium]
SIIEGMKSGIGVKTFSKLPNLLSKWNQIYKLAIPNSLKLFVEDKTRTDIENASLWKSLEPIFASENQKVLVVPDFVLCESVRTCIQIDDGEIGPKESFIKTYLQLLVLQPLIPSAVVSKKRIQINKNESKDHARCIKKTCVPSSYSCIYNVFDKDDPKAFYQDIIENLYHVKIDSKKDLKKEKIQELVYFFLLLMKSDRVSQINNLEFTDACVNDINSISRRDKIIAALISAARAFGFPSASKDNRMECLDWHPYTTESLFKHYFRIYRVDVVDSIFKNGLNGTSGRWRFIIVENGYKWFFLAYGDHDFDYQFIQNRINHLLSEIRKPR